MKKESVGKNRVSGLPFSPGVKYGDLIFVSGQGPIGRDGKVIAGDIKTQTRLTLENFQGVLEAAGATINDVVQTTVYLKDLGDYQGMNEVYASFFSDPKPARATVKADLLFGMTIEIQGIAALRRSQ
jgi:2-iminobutanoate/2-iminopropanoate deaminase